MLMLRKTLLSLFVLGVFFGTSFASYISLNTSVTSKVEKDKLKVFVSANNKGDEPAYNVQAEIRMGDKKVLTEKSTSVAVNDTYKRGAELSLNLSKPGQYPLVVIMHYGDANQYPFSALTVQTFAYKADPGLSEIFGKLKAITFWKEGKTSLILKNLAESVINTKTYLIIPQEISVKESRIESNIAPKSEAQIEFSFDNFSALTGSTYQIFAISEYEKDNIHQTNITPGLVKIIEEKKIMGISYTMVFSAMAILLVLLIGYQFLKK